MNVLLHLLCFWLFIGPGDWISDMKQAQVQAKQENKHILLNFSGSDWCAPCIQLKKEVFESNEFKQLADGKWVLVRADFPRLKKNQLPADQQAKNNFLAERYNPLGKFPLTLLLDAEGKVIATWEGFPSSKNKFLSELSRLP